MTSEAEADLAKNFRASYYESLGFRGGEKSLSHLEGLLKAEVLGTTADWSTVYVLQCLFSYFLRR